MITKPFPNHIVEDYETLTIDFADHISGSLMEFSVEIEDVTQGGKQTSKEILQEVKDSIYMKDLRNYWST